MKRKIIYIILSLVLPIFVSAQTISEATNLPISGSARAWLGLGNEQYNFPAAMAEVGIKANFGNKSYYSNLDFRFRSGYQFNQFNTTLDLKEAFVGFRTNSFDFSLGKKILDWSRVDYNSVVNPVMANDFFFISTESDDMKMAQLMLHISLEVVDRMKWQTVVIPVFTPSIYRFELFDLSDMGGFTNLPGIGGNSNSDNGGGFNIPGLDNIPDFSDWFDWGNIPGLGDLSGLSDLFGSNNLPTMNDAMPEIHFLEGKRPEQNFLNASIASRLTGDFNFASFGLTGFHGYSTGYGFTLNSITYLALPWQINMIPVYYKQSLLGFDAEIPIRNSIFKFEAAYNYIHDSVSEIPTELSLLFLADSKLTQMLEQMPYPSNGYHANIAIERMY
ncbi:MAG: hypothetical protein GX879_11550, partial [Bacteroidales bacterium]|nr:hypothetical protein [Bacteroidales bacterium]